MPRRRRGTISVAFLLIAGCSHDPGSSIPRIPDEPAVDRASSTRGGVPEVGESANDASAPFGWTEGQKQIRVGNDKFATISAQGMLEDIAEGLPMAERKLSLAVQGQSYGPMFDEKLTVADSPEELLSAG